MKELFISFLQDPTRESFLTIHKALVESEHYDAYSDEFKTIEEALDKEDWQLAQDTVRQSMPNLVLSPRAHLLLSFAADKLGDEDGAKMEQFVAATCCEGILLTGDGSSDNPYIVTRPSDEHDLLQYLGKEFAGQALVTQGDTPCDHIQCADETDLWFDISAPYNALSDRFADE